MLCHASVEGLFGFTYMKFRAFLCALNSIHNNTEIMPRCSTHGVDQSLSEGLAGFWRIILNFSVSLTTYAHIG